MAIVYKHYPGIEILSCTDPFEFKPHIHDRYVVWINTGCGEHFSVKGETDILSPGSISIFEPGLVHANHPCSVHDRHLRSFYITSDFFNDLAGQIYKEKSGFSGFERKPVKDPALWKQLAALHHDFITDTDSITYDERVIETFISLMERHGLHRIQPDLSKTDACDNRVIQAIDYFYAHLGREVPLKEVAALLNCTPYHLIRLFKAHKGMSPHAFLLQIRLEHARKRLENGQSISQAALDSGFSDQSHLTRAFKARYGLTPAVYRKRDL